MNYWNVLIFCRKHFYNFYNSQSTLKNSRHGLRGTSIPILLFGNTRSLAINFLIKSFSFIFSFVFTIIDSLAFLLPIGYRRVYTHFWFKDRRYYTLVIPFVRLQKFFVMISQRMTGLKIHVVLSIHNRNWYVSHLLSLEIHYGRLVKRVRSSVLLLRKVTLYSCVGMNGR